MNAAWLERLRELSDHIRAAVDATLAAAVEAGDLRALRERVAEGVGDWTFGIDVPSEEAVDGWLNAAAARGPLSLFSEDRGWRHQGPAGPLPGFDHGGPRIVVDPIDGTRNLMANLRPAWTVIGLAPPGPEQPRLSDLTVGVLSELPTTRCACFRRLEAAGGQVRLEVRDRAGALLQERPVRADADDRVDQGYFPFFRHAPALRPVLVAAEARFFARLAADGAQTETCYDDQYISSGGQLALLVLGTYRMICDARPWAGRQLGREVRSVRPYDVAGAVVVARQAGCVVEALDGTELDVPLDGTTPVGFVAWANPATAARLRPHLHAALEP